jgi:hypothetical protein
VGQRESGCWGKRTAPIARPHRVARERGGVSAQARQTDSRGPLVSAGASWADVG